MNRLQGKIALVTGASKGIGAAIAESMAAEGALVVVNYASSKSGAEAVVARIAQNGGKAVAVQADVSKPVEIERLVSEARKAFGRLDILVNNAGIYEFAPLESVTPEHFHKQFNLNVLGLLLTTQEAVRHFGPEGGSVVNISSVVATLCAAQHFRLQWHQSRRQRHHQVARPGTRSAKICVNAINPGMVETEGLHTAGLAGGDFRKQYEVQTPLGRIGQPQDIAMAAVYLASPESAWITGETLYITGGMR